MSGTVQTMSPGQMRDLAAAVIQCLPGQLPHDAAQGWIGSKGRLGEVVGNYLLLRSQIADSMFTRKVLVDPTVPLKEMIDRGRYDWVEPGFEQQEFDSVTGLVEPTNVPFALQCLKRNVWAQEVQRYAVDSVGLATLLTIGAQLPGLQCRHRIVALGVHAINRESWWRVPVLDFDGRGRTLCLVGVNTRWDWDTHFAVKA